MISVAATTESLKTNNEPVASQSDESVLQEDSALLRNFFSVNLHKKPQPPPSAHYPPRQQISHRKLPIVSKHTQKARLRGLFKALRNPLARKYHLHNGSFNYYIDIGVTRLSFQCTSKLG